MDRPTESRPEIERWSHSIYSAFLAHQAEFDLISRRAQQRFEERDWRGHQADAVARLRVRHAIIDRLFRKLSESLGEDLENPAIWGELKRCYAALIAGQRNMELCRTFFNSITRRVFATVGVNPDIEFLSLEPDLDLEDESTEAFRVFTEPTLIEQVRATLEALPFRLAWVDRERDARLIASRIRVFLESEAGGGAPGQLEVLRHIFYRQKLAVVVGRIRRGPRCLPMVLSLVHTAQGLKVDAVLQEEDRVSILFSFTRSYFLVDTRCPRDDVRFLRSIMPRKPIAELYIALGFIKHGKTELYRAIQRHLILSKDRFDLAEGERGMVMLVFATMQMERVFKLIRDEFDYPKKNTPQEVMDRYRLVFEHDRVGRLVDAQVFEHLTFRRALFSEPLLDELKREAAGSVEITDSEVIIRHLYIERKVTPLNLYLQSATEDQALAAVVDYGQAIRELAAANIFPGDFLLKNFGVTRHGRVVFYDYDELCLVTDCRFRRMPPPRNPEEEFAAETWFTVDEHDVFPEEFRSFLGLAGTLRQAFEKEHEEIYSAAWWNGLQERLRRGETPDVYPYPRSSRLAPSDG